MFSKPSRNHITIVPEQLGAVGLVLLTGALSIFIEYADSFGSGFDFSFMFRQITSGYVYPLVLVIALAVCLVFAVWSFIRWRKTVFYIDDGYLVVERNTLMRRVSRVPLGSISTVNLERNLFERIVGTAKIKLDINSAVTANSTDFVFVLRLDKAKVFESELVSFKSEKSGDETVNKHNLICSFSFSQALRDVVLGQSLMQILPSAASIGYSVYTGLWSAAAIFIVFGWIVSMLMQFVSACGFRIEKNEDAFFITSGLIKKKNYSFSSDKVNAVIIRRPMLARLFGLYRAEVVVVGLGNDKNETSQICLLVKKTELERIVAECAPDFVCSVKPERSHRAGLIASVGFYAVLFMVIGAALIQVHPALCAAAGTVGIVLGVLSRNGKKLAADGSVFSYSHGIFSLTYVAFRYNAIQTAKLCTNPLLKRMGAGKIRVSILGSSAVSVHTTGWFDLKRYDELSGKLGY